MDDNLKTVAEQNSERFLDTLHVETDYSERHLYHRLLLLELRERLIRRSYRHRSRRKRQEALIVAFFVAVFGSLEILFILSAALRHSG